MKEVKTYAKILSFARVQQYLSFERFTTNFLTMNSTMRGLGSG